MGGEANGRSRLTLPASLEPGGDISAFDHTHDHSAVQMARFLAAGALVAAVIALIAVVATWAELSGATARGVVAHSLAAHARTGARAHTRARSQPDKVGESPAFALPFPPNRADRPARPSEVPSLYADELQCPMGCRPYRAEIGWPLAPFHLQHPIRAGLNELRPESLHVGVDIQAQDGAAVFAVQPGVAQVLAPSGPDARVQVGNYIYWHITPRVRTGEPVTPFVTVLGAVMSGYGHIAFSELDAGGEYVNPLRPDGTVLEPYVDRAAPVISRPTVSAGGQVIVSAYDRQTFVRKTTYFTPVLAPAAIAYRLYDRRDAPVTPLEWAFRGTHLLPFAERSLIYAPGSHAPGYVCFLTRPVCVPHWTYRVAGGRVPPLPTLQPGRYRLTIYAWDWSDNMTAIDTTVTMTPIGWQPIGQFPTILFHIPGYYERDRLLPPPPPAARDPLASRVVHAPSHSLPSMSMGVTPLATARHVRSVHGAGARPTPCRTPGVPRCPRLSNQGRAQPPEPSRGRG